MRVSCPARTFGSLVGFSLLIFCEIVGVGSSPASSQPACFSGPNMVSQSDDIATFDATNNCYGTVRIEFEFSSSNFTSGKTRETWAISRCSKSVYSYNPKFLIGGPLATWEPEAESKNCVVRADSPSDEIQKPASSSLGPQTGPKSSTADSSSGSNTDDFWTSAISEQKRKADGSKDVLDRQGKQILEEEQNAVSERASEITDEEFKRMQLANDKHRREVAKDLARAREADTQYSFSSGNYSYDVPAAPQQQLQNNNARVQSPIYNAPRAQTLVPTFFGT